MGRSRGQTSDALEAPKFADLPDWPRCLKPELAAAYVGLSVSTILRMRATGEFPRPIAITRGRIVWLRETLDRWVDDRSIGEGETFGGLVWRDA